MPPVHERRLLVYRAFGWADARHRTVFRVLLWLTIAALYVGCWFAAPYLPALDNVKGDVGTLRWCMAIGVAGGLSLCWYVRRRPAEADVG